MEQAVFALLSGITTLTNLVSDRIRPIRPATGEQLPHCWYTLTANPTSTRLRGASNLTPYTLTVTVASLDLSQLSTALAAVKATLNGYTSADIKGCFFTGQTEGQDENDTPFRSQSFTVWG